MEALGSELRLIYIAARQAGAPKVELSDCARRDRAQALIQHMRGCVGDRLTDRH